MKRNTTKGISIVEFLVALSIVVSVSFALISGIGEAVAFSQKALKTNQASWLIEEGVEVVKIIRDTNWQTFQNTLADTNYYISYNNQTNVWSISPTDTGLIDNTFDRKITFQDVYRDTNDDIASSGTLDPNTKKVNVIVDFNSGETPIQKSASFYISDIFE